MWKNTPHKCDLPKSSETCIPVLPPYVPNYKRWFRTLKKCTILNSKYKRSVECFRSHAAIIAERKRHARYKHFVVHPFSALALFRELVLVILYLIAFFVDPFIAFVSVKFHINTWLVIQYIVDIFLFICTVGSYYFGHFKYLTKEIILDRKGIISVRKKMMLLDIAGCLPITTMIYMMKSNCDGLLNCRLYGFTFIKCCRLFKYPIIKSYIKLLLGELNASETFTTSFNAIIITCLFAHLNSCLFYSIPLIYYTANDLPKSSWINAAKINPIKDDSTTIQQYLASLVTATSHFYGVDEGDYILELPLERLIGAILLATGFLYWIVFMAFVLLHFGSSQISETKYEELLHQLKGYIRYKNLPEGLKQRLLTYYGYKFKKRYFNEKEILNTLSDHLRYEIFLYSCRNILKKVPIFYGMSKSAVGGMISHFKQEVYLSNDVILRYGDPVENMYFIVHGTVALYTKNGVEILHYEDGDHFGEISIYSNNACLLNIVAIEITETFVLNKQYMKNKSTHSREILEKLEADARDKYRFIQKMTNFYENDTDKGAMSYLRRGKILERPQSSDPFNQEFW